MLKALTSSLRLAALFAALTLAMPILPAAAATLDSAKAQGLVGEKPDGLLGAVTPPSADVQSLINTVNAKRLALFNDIAAKKGQSLDAVKAVSGQEFIDRTPAGQFIMTPAGQWVKK